MGGKASMSPYASPFRNDKHAFAAITGLPKNLQGTIARIVWWDWYAGRTADKRSVLFDQWLTPPRNEVEPPYEDCVRALISIGYKPEIAQRRFAQTTM